MKVLQSAFYLPILFKDAQTFEMHYDKCKRKGNISRRQ